MTARETEATSKVLCYFSLRSPYSWLALHRLSRALAPLAVAVDYIPVFPPPDFANDPLKVPFKAAYYAHDVARIAEAYGLAFRSPEPFDCNWVRPHAALIHARDAGAELDFAQALFAARFERGEDLGSDAVIAACARASGLDPEATVAAQDQSALQERLVHGMIQAVEQDQLFGVPLFVYRGERFWGNDRVEWLLRSIQRQQGLEVPDLRAAPLSAVWRTS